MQIADAGETIPFAGFFTQELHGATFTADADADADADAYAANATINTASVPNVCLIEISLPLEVAHRLVLRSTCVKSSSTGVLKNDE